MHNIFAQNKKEINFKAHTFLIKKRRKDNTGSKRSNKRTTQYLKHIILFNGRKEKNRRQECIKKNDDGRKLICLFRRGFCSCAAKLLLII